MDGKKEVMLARSNNFSESCKAYIIYWNEPDRRVKSICLLNVVIKQGILSNTHKTKQATSCRVTCNRVPFITRYCVFIQVMTKRPYAQKLTVWKLFTNKKYVLWNVHLPNALHSVCLNSLSCTEVGIYNGANSPNAFRCSDLASGLCPG